MPMFLEQAQAALHQRNWPLLLQSLQQLVAPQEQGRWPTDPCRDVDPILDLLCQGLILGDFQTRWDLAQLFPPFGPRAIAPLLALLEFPPSEPMATATDGEEDGDWELPWFIARILGTLRHPEVPVALGKILESSPHPEVAEAAAFALGHYGPEAIPGLIPLLSQEATRFLAVQALLQIDSPPILSPLLQVLPDLEPPQRAIALGVLGSYPDPRIPPPLLQALGDPSPEVRKAGAMVLGGRRDLVGHHDLLTPLLRCLGDPDPEVASQGAIALGRLGQESALPSLGELLWETATPFPLRQAVVQALGLLETPAALTLLADVLPSFPDNLPLIQTIITTLGQVQDPQAQLQASAILREILGSIQDPHAQKLLALTLGTLGDPRSVPTLVQLLLHPQAMVRWHSLAALKQMNQPETAQALQALASSTPVPFPEVAIALGHWAP